MDLFTLEESSTTKKPLYIQIYDHISNEIISGKLKTGEKIPSKKLLSSHLNISVTTIENAYSMLLDEGYINSKARSGYYVSKLEVLKNKKNILEKNLIKDTPSPKYNYDFKTNSVDLDSFPYVTWSKINRKVLYNKPELISIGDTKGDFELRDVLSKYLHEFRGVNCNPNQVIIGAGIEYLLILLCNLFEKDTIFGLENPGYYKSKLIIENSNYKTINIPLDKNGLSINSLKKSKANNIYITPSHQFPTGIIMPVGRRTELLNWANESKDRYIIEDDYSNEFYYSGKPISALQGIDNQKVIYLSTFSRALAPSIRIAYMVLPFDLLEIFNQKYKNYSSTVSRFEQHTLSMFISGGYLSRHRNKVKNIYKKRVEILKEYFKKNNIEFIGGNAGLHILIKLNKIPRKLLIEHAETINFKLHFLSELFLDSTKRDNILIIGYGESTSEKIIEGLDKLLAPFI